MGSRAGIVVTGTEVLTGRVPDRNGPWLAEQLRAVGVDIAHIMVVGDRPGDLREALAFLRSGVQLIITSGGLGPTADDMTAAVVADSQGRPMRFDADLERRIAAIVDRLSRNRGWLLHPQATAAATRKQAQVPEGAEVLDPVGTAPGLIVPATDPERPPVVVLPGPPRELQTMWPAAINSPIIQAAIGRREELRQRTIRLWGTPESELAAVLRQHDFDPLEITTCLRDGGELEIVTRYRPTDQDRYDRLTTVVVDAFDTVFSVDGRTVDEIVADAMTGKTIATAESCTGGMLAARLIDRPGSSAYLLAGFVTYSNEAKQQLLGVPADLIERVGAVSAEVAREMARGACRRIGADIGVGITGVAGPGGGSADKPVGLVHLCAVGADREISRRINVPGSRRDVRERSVSVTMHLLRELLTSP